MNGSEKLHGNLWSSNKRKKIQLEGIVELMKREGRNFRVKGLNGDIGIGERRRWVELYKTNNTRRCPTKTY